VRALRISLARRLARVSTYERTGTTPFMRR
jgi:hypothetical protein